MSLRERWISVKEFPKYLASDKGRIKNVETGRILKQSVNSNGYPLVTLYNNVGKFPKAVHQLVSLSFLGVTPKGLEINHVDGVKSNNNVDNFEFVTRSENIKHAFSMGLASHSPLAGSKKIPVKNLETGEVFESISAAAKSVSASQWHVSQVLKGKGKTVKGHHFEYVD